jgi:hypothetical protein
VGLETDNLVTSITKEGLQTNLVFAFKYRVKNKYGWSTGFSPVLKARSAKLPLQVTGLTFELINLLNI